MKINLTKKEYETLLDVLYIADWVTRAHEEEASPALSHFKEFEQRIMSLAGEYGLDDCVDRNKETGLYYLTKQHLNGSDVTAKIENFENATFWEELLERLARRDFIRQYGEAAILKMPVSERFEKEIKFFEKYDKEFGINGLDNLVALGLATQQDDEKLTN